MEDRCVCCGEIIPEGSGMVCKICEERILHEEKSEKPPEKESGFKKILKRFRRLELCQAALFFVARRSIFWSYYRRKKKSERRYYEV